MYLNYIYICQMINKFYASISSIIDFKKTVGIDKYQNAFRQMQYFTIPKQMKLPYVNNKEFKEILVKPSKKQ